MHAKRRMVAALIAGLLFSSTAMADTALSLNDLQEMGRQEAAPESFSAGMRMEAIRSTAVGVGTRGGLASRAGEINAELQSKAAGLDKIYNFRRLMISTPAGHDKKGSTDYLILPPVIEQSNDIYEVDSDTRIHIADAAYDILTQARFVSAPPSWRDYLQMLDVGAVEKPHESILPRDDKERALWRDWVKQGWALGVEQADAILQENLARLSRDFRGIIKYRELLAEGKVSRPFVAQAEMGTRGDDTGMVVGERILRITTSSGLVSDQEKWKPVVRSVEAEELPVKKAIPIKVTPAIRMYPDASEMEQIR